MCVNVSALNPSIGTTSGIGRSDIKREPGKEQSGGTNMECKQKTEVKQEPKDTSSSSSSSVSPSSSHSSKDFNLLCEHQ